MHQIGCVAEDHATEYCSEVDCSLDISYLLIAVLERVVFTAEHSWDPEKETVHTQLCAEETDCVQCNSGYGPRLPEADMTVHFLMCDTFLVLDTQFDLLSFCLDTVFIFILMKRFIKFWHDSHFNASLRFCVLLNDDPDSFRIRYEEEPQHYPP